MKKICLTGATGLIGIQLLKDLLQTKNYEILAIYNNTSPESVFPQKNELIQWKKVDLQDICQLNRVFQEVDFVIHAAALVSFSDKDKEKLYKVNVEGTANVVNACLEQGIEKLCYVSSVAAIGRSGTNLTLNEEHRWEESEYISNYSRTKHLAELELWRAIAEGLNAVIVNPSVVLGEGDWHRSSTQIFRYIWESGKFYTDGILNYVDVRDVSQIIIKLLESDITDERFILNAGITTYKDIFDKIAKHFQKVPPNFRITPNLANVLWRFAKIGAWFTGKAPLITREIAQNAKSQYQYDGSKIQEKINFQFQSLEETLAHTCKALLKKYSKKA